MEILIVIIIVILFLGKNAEEKAKRAGKKPIIKQPDTAMQEFNQVRNSNSSFGAASDKQVKESKAYKKTVENSSETLLKQLSFARPDDVQIEGSPDLPEYSKKYRKKAEKKAVEPDKTKEPLVEEVADRLSVQSTNVEYAYGHGIFDDFAASDALYLAKKDSESRKLQISW